MFLKNATESSLQSGEMFIATIALITSSKSEIPEHFAL
jgi:hypothetical protein